GAAGDERGDGFLDVLLDVCRGVDLVGSADLADHQDAVRVGVCIERGDAVDVVHAADGIAPDAGAGALGKPEVAGLPDGLIGEGARAADDADGLAEFALGDVAVDVAGHDADLAPAAALAGAGVGV